MPLLPCACCPPPHPTRRRLIAAAAALATTRAAAQTPPPPAQTAPWRIDVHHHVSPPAWLASVKRAGLDNPPMSAWSLAASLDAMDQAGIQTSVITPPPPHVAYLKPPEAAAIARNANEFATGLRADHKGRFGVFAVLPLPDIDAALAETAYGLDTLGADGVAVLTSYGDKWLGHPSFDPLWAELDRRRAVVYTHPTSAACCTSLLAGIPDYAIEWGTDTVRAITTLVFGGASTRFPNIRWIFSHGGGALTAFSERLLIQLPGLPAFKAKWTRQAVQRELDRFTYDTAQVANVSTIDALANLVPLSQIVLGSDWDYRTPLEHVQGLAARFPDATQRAIERDNSLRLLPRLGA